VIRNSIVSFIDDMCRISEDSKGLRIRVGEKTTARFFDVIRFSELLDATLYY